MGYFSFSALNHVWDVLKVVLDLQCKLKLDRNLLIIKLIYKELLELLSP